MMFDEILGMDCRLDFLPPIFVPIVSALVNGLEQHAQRRGVFEIGQGQSDV